MQYVIVTIWVAILEDGSWDVAATRSDPQSDLTNVLSTVDTLRQRSDVLACEHKIHIKEGEKK